MCDMKSASVFLMLLLSTVAGHAAQEPVSASTADPYDGILKGRTYTSPFFGFSLKLPKGWTSQYKALQPTKFLSPERIERLKAEFRERGVLLNAFPQIELPIPGRAPLISKDPPYGAENKNPYGPRNPSAIPGKPQPIVITGPRESLSIIAYPVTDIAIQSGKEVLEQDMLKLRFENPSVEVSEAKEVTIDGQRFFRSDYLSSPDPKGKQSIFSTRYVTVLKGYILTFTVIAGEAKKREQLLGMIDAVRFKAE